MANGEQHFQAYKNGARLIDGAWLLLWIASWFIPIPKLIVNILFSAVLHYWIVCRYVEPDLDQISKTSSETRMERELPIFGRLFVIYWSFYAAVLNMFGIIFRISKGHLGIHRTWLTHSWIGTLIRIAWFNFPLLIIYDLFLDIAYLFQLGNIPIEFYIAFFAGQLIAFFRSDSIHYKLDGII